MATYNAIVFDKEGRPEEVLYMKSLPKPTLRSESDILVKVKATPIHPAELYYAEGKYAMRAQTFPAVNGFEGTGIVEQAGSETGLKVGQRIHFISPTLGAWAEYALLDTKIAKTVPLPDGISDEAGSQLTVNPLTAFGLLVDLGVKEGEYLLQTAASSALGKFMIAYAKLKGVKTINIVRGTKHHDALKKLGADRVIDAESGNLVDQVKKIAPEGVKYIAECVGGKIGSDAIACMAPGGKALIYGQLSFEPLTIPNNTLTRGESEVKGFLLAAFLTNRSTPEQIQGFFGDVFGLILSGKVELESKTFDAKTQLKEAIQHANQKGKTEKTILLF